MKLPPSSRSRRMLPCLRAAALVFTLSSAVFTVAAAPDAAPPAAAKRPVTNTYHGVKVQDDYQWLERADDPEVKAWTALQNRSTRAYLDALPERPAIAARLTELYDKVSPNYSALASRPAGLFALRFQPPQQQPVLVVMPSADAPDAAKVVLDPNALEPKGKVTIDWFVPSPKGKLVAVSLSQNGSEDGTLYFYNTDTGEKLSDAIPRVQYPTGGGSAAWVGEEGVFYTRYPHAGERPEADLNFYQQIYWHRLGEDPKKDDYAIGKEFPRIAETALESSPNRRYIIATVADGDGGSFVHYICDRQQKTLDWNRITSFEDKVKAIHFGQDNSLYWLSVQDAPRGKIMLLQYEADEWPKPEDAKVVIPEDPEAAIESLTLTDKHLFVTDLAGGPSQVRRFDLDGSHPVTLPLPPVSSVGQPVALEGDKAGGVLLRQTSYTTPFAWMRFDPAAGDELKKTDLAGTSPVDMGDIEAVREFATSKDGIQVPLNILRRKGTKLDGKNPTLLYGYGGYNISLTPSFAFSRRLWFDRGGVYVVANLRGGGEYGEAWHAAGNLTHKQNVFDDFAAAAEYLVKAGYTNPQKLAVEGGSNGGLLMGAFLTQHPDLARAVVSHVGIYDMLRVELDPNGAFNVPEFGTVKDPAQFQALHAYSPYHQVANNTQYPAVLFMTGDQDGRVNPLHSRKMAARLQAANASDHPILLRTTGDAGHGMGTALSERIAQEADGFAFLFDQLGMKELPAPTPTPEP